jgi:hypothetical protein
MTTVTPELEAVAKAIYETQSVDGHEWWKLKEIADRNGYSNAQATRSLFLARARAALLAIREPTDEMLEAMSRTHHANTTTRWNIAIDHILGVKP